MACSSCKRRSGGPAPSSADRSVPVLEP
jgi:hypothetical protein